MYTGELAERIVTAVANNAIHPGGMTLEDLASHEARTTTPICSGQRQIATCRGLAPAAGCRRRAQGLHPPCPACRECREGVSAHGATARSGPDQRWCVGGRASGDQAVRRKGGGAAGRARLPPFRGDESAAPSIHADNGDLYTGRCPNAPGSGPALAGRRRRKMTLTEHVEHYVTFRHALGHAYVQQARCLQDYATHAEARGERFVRSSTVLEWASTTDSTPASSTRPASACPDGSAPVGYAKIDPAPTDPTTSAPASTRPTAAADAGSAP